LPFALQWASSVSGAYQWGHSGGSYGLILYPLFESNAPALEAYHIVLTTTKEFQISNLYLGQSAMFETSNDHNSV